MLICNNFLPNVRKHQPTHNNNTPWLQQTIVCFDAAQSSLFFRVHYTYTHHSNILPDNDDAAEISSTKEKKKKKKRERHARKTPNDGSIQPYRHWPILRESGASQRRREEKSVIVRVRANVTCKSKPRLFDRNHKAREPKYHRYFSSAICTTYNYIRVHVRLDCVEVFLFVLRTWVMFVRCNFRSRWWRYTAMK